MTSYPYTKISDNLAIPAAPILAVLLTHIELQLIRINAQLS